MRWLLSVSVIALATVTYAPEASHAEGGDLADSLRGRPAELTVGSITSRNHVKPSTQAFPGFVLRGTVSEITARDPRLLEASANVRVMEAGVVEQLMRFTPVVTASLDTRLDIATGPDSLFRDESIDDMIGKVAVSLPLYTGGQRTYSLKRAEELALAERYRFQAARDNVAIEAVGLWVEAWLSKREAVIVDDRLGRLKRLRTSLASRQTQGFASASDVARLDAEIAGARRSYNDVVAKGAKATARLGTLSGRATRIAGELPRLGRHLPADKGQLIAMARRTNPNLQAAAADYRASVHQQRASYGRLLPRVDATAEYRYDMERAPLTRHRDGFTFGLSLKVPLVDLATGAANEADRARSDAALAREAQSLNSMEIEIDSLWLDRQSLKANRQALDDEVAARKRSADAARDRFAKGFGDLEEVIDAENALDDSRRAAVLSKGQAVMVEARLLAAAGAFKVAMLGQ